jgi:peptidoglycan biosynthesis protein MviN/MurJ (putative lipid II flippase)
MALLSSGISQNVLHWPRMHQIKPYIKTICFAASIFVLDAVILNQGFVALILILLALFVFFPFALLLRRRDRRKYEQRLVKIAIYVLIGVAVLGSNTLQNRIADRRAIAIGNACLAYRAKYYQYPAGLTPISHSLAEER